MKTRLVLLSLLLLLPLQAILSANEVFSRPEIQILKDTNSQQIIDIGKVLPEQRSVFYIQFKNTSNRELVLTEAHSSCSCAVLSGSIILAPQSSGSLLLSVDSSYELGYYKVENITKWKIKNSTDEILHKLEIRHTVFDGLSTERSIALNDLLQNKSLLYYWEYTLADPEIVPNTFAIQSTLPQLHVQQVGLSNNKIKCKIEGDLNLLTPGAYRVLIQATCRTKANSIYTKTIPFSFYIPGEIESSLHSIYVSCQDGRADGSFSLESKGKVDLEDIHFKSSENITVEDVEVLSKNRKLIKYRVRFDSSKKSTSGKIIVLDANQTELLLIPFFIGNAVVPKAK